MISVKLSLSPAADLATNTRTVHQNTAGKTPMIVADSGDRGFAGSEDGKVVTDFELLLVSGLLLTSLWLLWSSTAAAAASVRSSGVPL